MEEKDFAFHHDSRNESDYHNWTDNDLVAICREGSTDTYEPLVRRYAQDVYRMTYALAGNAEDAYDLTEEAFITGFPEVRKIKAPAPYSVVLFRAAIKGSIRLLRGEGLSTSSEPEIGFDLGWRSPGLSPLQGGYCSVEALRTRRGVEAAVACLPTEEKLALVLRDVVGFSVEHAANVLQWPIRKMKARLAAAREIIYHGLHPEPETIAELKHCEKSADSLSDYMEGQLPPKQYNQLADHFRECRQCAESLKKMEETLSEVARTLDHKLPGDIWRTISTRISSGKIESHIKKRPLRRGILWRLIAMVALFLSLVFGGGRLIVDEFQSKPVPIVRHAQPVPSVPLNPNREVPVRR